MGCTDAQRFELQQESTQLRSTPGQAQAAQGELQPPSLPPSRDDHWQQRLQELREFEAQHGRLPLEKEGALGAWVRSQRRGYKAFLAGEREARGMTAARAAALEAVAGWVGDIPSSQWNWFLTQLESYVSQHGHLPPTTDEALGAWVRGQRAAYRAYGRQGASAVMQQRFAALERVPGWVWREDLESEWQRRLQKLHQFVAEHNCLPHAGEPPLGRWARQQRATHRALLRGEASIMTAHRMAALEAVPYWTWEVDVEQLRDEDWQRRLGELQEFVAGHGRLPWRKEGPLGGWVGTQRRARKALDQGGQGRLRMTQDRVAALEAVPHWKW